MTRHPAKARARPPAESAKHADQATGHGAGQGLVDLWSLGHLVAGAVFGALAVPWWGLLALAVGYEGFEDGLRRNAKSVEGIFAPESWKNMVADILVAAAGWAMAAFVRFHWFRVPS